MKIGILSLMVLFYSITVVSAQISGEIAQNDIKVVIDHIFISKKNNSLEVSEVVVFRNEGALINYSMDNHTFFALSTPHDAKNLKTQAMECCLVEEEGMVLMDPMQSLKPGDNFEMQVSYTLILQGSKYVFNKTALYNTTSLSIFVDKIGLSVEGSHETLTLNGNDYYFVVFNDVKASEAVVVPIKITANTFYLYAGILLFFFLILAYNFRKKLFKWRKYTLEELELEKRKIFQTIQGFEKHAGNESSEEYRRLMDEYRQKAIQIFIKMDNIKR